MPSHSSSQRNLGIVAFCASGASPAVASKAFGISRTRVGHILRLQAFRQAQREGLGVLPEIPDVELLNCLLAAGLCDVPAVRQAYESGELAKVPGVGPKRLQTVAQWLEARG